MTDQQIAWSLGVGFVMLSAPIAFDVLRHRKRQRVAVEKLQQKREEHEAARKQKEKEEAEERKAELNCFDHMTLVAEKQDDEILELISKPFHSAAYVDAFVMRCCSQCTEMATCGKQETIIARNIVKNVQKKRKERQHAARVKEILAELK